LHQAEKKNRRSPEAWRRIFAGKTRAFIAFIANGAIATEEDKKAISALLAKGAHAAQ